MSLHRIEQLFLVVSDAVLENDFDVFDISDTSGRITFHHHQVRILSDGNRADAIVASEEDRAVQSGDANGLHRWKAGVDQQLDFPLIAKAWNVAADADRIWSREKEAAGCHECPLEVHVAAKQKGDIGLRGPGPIAPVEVRFARGR